MVIHCSHSLAENGGDGLTTKRTRLHKILGQRHFVQAYLRENGLITHEASSDEVVSHQRKTERECFEIVSGKKPLVHPTHNGGFDATQYKKCSHCKQSRKLQYFGTKTIKNKKGIMAVYYQSWCNFCMAEYAAEQYRKSFLSIRG
jgi:hypothetical protein